jgi:hypothetical protein
LSFRLHNDHLGLECDFTIYGLKVSRAAWRVAHYTSKVHRSHPGLSQSRRFKGIAMALLTLRKSTWCRLAWYIQFPGTKASHLEFSLYRLIQPTESFVNTWF